MQNNVVFICTIDIYIDVFEATFSRYGEVGGPRALQPEEHFQPDVYETNVKLFCFLQRVTFPMRTNAVSSFLLLDSGYQILATKSLLLDPGYQILAT